MIDFVRRYPVSIAIQTLVISIGWLTMGSSEEQHELLLEKVGVSWDILAEGKFWHILTGSWFQTHIGLGWEMASMCAMVALGTFPLEHMIGSKLTAPTVILADWFATTMTAVSLRIAVPLGDTADRALLHTADSGSSAIAWGGMAAGAMVSRWRLMLVPAVVIAVLAQFVYETPAPAIAHGWAVAFGLTVGWRLRPESQSHMRVVERAPAARTEP